MSEVNLFEIDSREGYLYPSQIGMVTSTDLWKLPLVVNRNTGASLDGIARTLYAELKEQAEVSFVDDVVTSPQRVMLERKLEIVKHIIAVKKAEALQAKEAANRLQEKQRLLALKAQKQDARYLAMTETELDAELAKLG